MKGKARVPILLVAISLILLLTVNVSTYVEAEVNNDAVGDLNIYVLRDSEANLQKLTTSTANDYEPDWSPDGSKIVFTSDHDGNTEVFVMNADGSNVVQLTTTSSPWHGFPVWSPDGTRIAYTEGPPAANAEVWVMNANGSNKQRLANTPSDCADPTWSPDSTKIAFLTRQSSVNHDIHVINADGSSRRPLIVSPYRDQEPEWSPDGRKIAFASDRSGNYEIYVANADGTNPTRLTTDAASDRNPAWSPDGSKIVFHSNRGGNADLYMMNADGSNVVRLTTHAADDHGASWKPTSSGLTLAFASNRTDPPPPFEWSNCKWQVSDWNVPGLGKDGADVHFNPNNVTQPAASPDGKLHLRVARDNAGVWQSAEVVCDEIKPVGKTTYVKPDYGEYRFQIETKKMNPNITLGLFLFKNMGQGATKKREIDIEYGDMGITDGNAQYVLQPLNEGQRQPGDILRVDLPADASQYIKTTHILNWQEHYVHFRSISGHTSLPPTPQSVLHEWRYTGINVPPLKDDPPPPPPLEDKYTVILNLWVWDPNVLAPADAAEVIISKVELVQDTSPPNAAPIRNYFVVGDTLPAHQLSWSRISWAVRYTLQVDDDPLFRSPEYERSIFGLFLQHDLPGLPSGHYWWHVKAHYVLGGVTSWGTDSLFLDTHEYHHAGYDHWHK